MHQPLFNGGLITIQNVTPDGNGVVRLIQYHPDNASIIVDDEGVISSPEIEQLGPWRQDNVFTDQSPPVPVSIGGGAPANLAEYVAMRPGVILALVYRSNGALASGTADARAQVNGVNVGIPGNAHLTTVVQQKRIDYTTPVAFASGDRLGVTFGTNSVYGPDQTLDHVAYLLVRWTA